MDLKSYLVILWGNKWVVISTVVVTVAIVVAATFLTTPIYSASTTLRIATASIGSVSYTDYIYADRLMNTYTKIGTSGPILQELKSRLDLLKVPEVKIVMIPSTELIKVSVEDANPQIAQNAANTLAEILVEQSKNYYSGGGKSPYEILGEQLAQIEGEVEQMRDDYSDLLAQSPDDSELIAQAAEALQLKENTYDSLLSQYEQTRLQDMFRENIISIVEPAELPEFPSKPNKLLNITLGTIIGLVGGIGLVFLIEIFDTRMYTTEHVESFLELMPLGKIPTLNGNNNPLTMKSGRKKVKYSLFKESFRRLQVNILSVNSRDAQTDTVKSIMLTSASPGEGKSTIIKNLGIAFAQSGKKTLIVDCDLRIPNQHKLVGLSNKQGLSDLLLRQNKIEDVIQNTLCPGLYFISSGPVPGNPTELLGSSLLKTIIHLLTTQFDIVLIDSPALLPVADATQISKSVDAVILVTRLGFSKLRNVQEAFRQLSDIRANTIGIVINNAERNGTYYYHKH